MNLEPIRITLITAIVCAWAGPLNAQLLVSDNFGNQVISYDPVTGEFIDVLVAMGDGGVSGPVGMLIDDQGDLLVASQLTNSILKYDVQTGDFLGVFASADNGNAFAGPAQIEIGPDGNIYVANFDFPAGDSVDRVSPDGTGLGPFTNGGPGIAGTASFAFGPDGNLYVASFNTGEVQVFDGNTGDYLQTLASALPGATGLLFDTDGDLWVASLFSHVISRLDKDGQVVQSFSTGADTFPSDIILNPNDESELLIALTGAAGVYRFTSLGMPLGPFAFGGGLTVPGESLVVESIVLGDVNGDGIVSLLDVDPFVQALNTGTYIPEADVNQDGIVSLLDVAPFIDILSS